MESWLDRVLLRLLLGLYPRGFRKLYGEDLQMFVSTERSGVGSEVGSVLSFWFVTFIDSTRVSVVLRVRGLSDAMANFFDFFRRRFFPMDQIANDMRLGFRSVFRRFNFSVIVIATLSIAIGATTVIFAAINSVLLQPLPFPDSERIVHLEGAPFAFTSNGMSVSDRVPALSTIEAAGIYATGGANVGSDARTVRINGAQVSRGFFETFRVPAEHGRFLMPQEEETGGAVVLSNDLWRTLLGADTGVVGSTLRLNGENFSVVGIMPASFDFPRGSQFWVSTGALPMMSGAALAPSYVARIGPDRYPLAVAEELDALNRSRVPDGVDYEEAFPSVTRLRDHQARDVQKPLLVLLGTVGVVLLVACLNVTNLYLSQVSRRKNEFVLRVALGASKSRFVTQLLAETGVLAVCAGIFGTLLARLGIVVIQAEFPDVLPVTGVSIDATVMTMATMVVVGCTMAVSLAPALYAGRSESNGALRVQSSGMTDGRRWTKLRDVLLVAQIALALVLVFGSGLLVRTFTGLYNTELGFARDEVITTKVSFPANFGRRPDGNDLAQRKSARYDFYDRVQSRIGGTPGVLGVGLVSNLPLDPSIGVGMPVKVPGYIGDPVSDSTAGTPESVAATFQMASSTYFEAMGIPFVVGETFNRVAADDGLVETVISRSLAERIGTDPIGMPITMGRSIVEGVIVGVVENVRSNGPSSRQRDEVYILLHQWPFVNDVFIAVRTTSPGALAALIPDIVDEVHPDLPSYATRTADQLLDNSLARRRFSMTLMSLLGSIALILAVLGVYGTISHSVSLREREIGVRMALGASPGAIKLMVLTRVGILVGVGVSFGIVGAINVGAVFRNMVYGVSTSDPVVLFVGALMVSVAGIVAGYLPSAVAAKIDPMSILKES